MGSATRNLDMSPGKPLENLVNGPAMNFKLPSKRPYSATFAVKLSDGENLLVCQLGVRVFFATWPASQPAFYNSVMNVVLRSTFKEMGRVNATWPIASVANKQCRIALIGKKECNPMSKQHLAINPKVAVPLLSYIRLPILTFIWTALINIIPKALNLIWGQWLNWFNLILGHVVSPINDLSSGSGFELLTQSQCPILA